MSLSLFLAFMATCALVLGPLCLPIRRGRPVPLAGQSGPAEGTAPDAPAPLAQR
ncbi:hypothetical protein JAN5088_02540 [Jannaschia rubra]|uniref:Uncharacterized protein n=1 Tax=Jannaschia rubra TaxID=282197 RepID=A0A0M6XUW9_9RHOB|nr:hypothetical protein JAN5088_02540 [Jannaschia rubra]SFG08193.1 hypothetical protein SAMN04488517_102589 [Jannaschia rubra]